MTVQSAVYLSVFNGDMLSLALTGLQDNKLIVFCNETGMYEVNTED